MLIYPGHQKKDNYLQSLIQFYRKSYPMFSEEEIKKPIERVLFYISSVLDDNILEPIESMKWENAKFLTQMFDLTIEEFSLIKKMPKAIFEGLFYLVKGKPEVVKFILSQGGGIEISASNDEKYLEFIANMTRKCSIEIGKLMIENFDSDKEKKRSKARVEQEIPPTTEKKVAWASDSIVFSSSTRKRKREEGKEPIPSELEIKRQEKTFHK